MVRTPATKSMEMVVKGVVQGVGFRPFVYRLALRYGLAGWVRNTSSGVEIDVEGDAVSVDSFVTALAVEAPAQAKIEEIVTKETGLRGYGGFFVRESREEEGRYQLISPDIATCGECLKEVFSPADRRYRYPFTNCTNCGPRFTIIEDIPYDRQKTTMRHFEMCADCRREYDDPLDRRFHAQPNACPKCGPSLELVNRDGSRIVCTDPVREAARLLGKGSIVAIKGLGGFLLACDATNPVAVETLRQRKRRPSKPLAVMVGCLEEIRQHCFASVEEERLLASPQSPIVLLRWKDGSSVCPEVAPGVRYLGVMLPYTPLHHLLLAETSAPLVMTSGNLSEEPIAGDNAEALARLGSIADYFLLHDRDIYALYDDSVFVVQNGIGQAVRRARGFAPYPVALPFSVKQVLACGAEDKNTLCLTRDKYAFVSQHIGDMENEETLEHFEDTINLYERLFRIEPETVACDLHPEYLSTKYAVELTDARQSLRLVHVQHHHAHLASCLVDNGVDEDAIGVVFDGSGYGSDGAIWGGEFLVGGLRAFKRVGHLEYVRMPGGAAAIKKPYRMALSYLHTFCRQVQEKEALTGRIASPPPAANSNTFDSLDLKYLPLFAEVDPAEIMAVGRQLELGFNSPLTSSAGRLFDAVSALAGVRGTIDYEAQAAIELEMVAPDEVSVAEMKPYPFLIAVEEGCRVVKLGQLVRAVLADVGSRKGAALVSARFHRTVADVIVEMCQAIARETGIKVVVLTGGVFQNRLLFGLVTRSLGKHGFRVLSHRLVPCNDGGISLGQAVIAHFVAS